MPKNSKKKLIIFDMDGTLYDFKEGSFKFSKLQKVILRRAKLYIANRLGKNQEEAGDILQKIIDEHGEHISSALEKLFGLDRYDYFNTVWNIPAKNFINPNPYLKSTLRTLVKQYDMALVSDAPQIWIHHVLKELKIEDFFLGKIFSGESDIRKGFRNAFQIVTSNLGRRPEECVVVGDQEQTDIIPAKKLGALAILVSPIKKQTRANIIIHSINELPTVLNMFAISVSE